MHRLNSNWKGLVAVALCILGVAVVGFAISAGALPHSISTTVHASGNAGNNDNDNADGKEPACKKKTYAVNKGVNVPKGQTRCYTISIPKNAVLIAGGQKIKVGNTAYEKSGGNWKAYKGNQVTVVITYGTLVVVKQDDGPTAWCQLLDTSPKWGVKNTYPLAKSWSSCGNEPQVSTGSNQKPPASQKPTVQVAPVPAAKQPSGGNTGGGTQQKESGPCGGTYTITGSNASRDFGNVVNACADGTGIKIDGVELTKNGQPCFATGLTGRLVVTNGVFNPTYSQIGTHPPCGGAPTATTGSSGGGQPGPTYDTVNGRKRCSKDTNNGQNCPLYPNDFADGANMTIGGKKVASGQACYVEVVPSVAGVAAGQPVGSTDGVANPFKQEAATAKTRSACSLSGISVVTASATTQSSASSASASQTSSVTTKTVTLPCQPGNTPATSCCEEAAGRDWCKSYINRVNCQNLCDGYYTCLPWYLCSGQPPNVVQVPVGGGQTNPTVLGGQWKQEGAGWSLLGEASLTNKEHWMLCVDQKEWNCKDGSNGVPAGTGLHVKGAYAEYHP